MTESCCPGLLLAARPEGKISNSFGFAYLFLFAPHFTGLGQLGCCALACSLSKGKVSARVCQKHSAVLPVLYWEGGGAECLSIERSTVSPFQTSFLILACNWVATGKYSVSLRRIIHQEADDRR